MINMSNPEQEKSQDKPVFFVPEEPSLPGALSDMQKVMLLLLLLAAISGLGYRIFFRGAIRLVSPGKLSALAAKDLAFGWKCNRPDLSFVLEVYDGTEM